MHYHMQKALSAFNLQIESKMQLSLAHLFGEVYEDNQRVLSTLFAMKDNFPLRHASLEKKVAVGALANRDVLLLLSSPIIDLDQLLLLVQQLEFNPSDELEKPYEVLWVPIGSAMQWSDDEKKGFSELLRIVPWYSVDPSVLCSSVIDFFREDWQFHDAPLVVVLNPKGSIASFNALDMILVWGAKAYPFTVLRERELWDGQVSPMQILMDEIDPLTSHWVEVGTIICLYGSNNIEWIRELSRKMNGIMQAGLSVVLIYVGSKNFENLRDILTTIIRENLNNSLGLQSSLLSITKIKFFWIRLESIRNLKIRIESQSGCDSLLGEVSSLLKASCENEDWLLTGEGLLTNFLRGIEVLDCLERFDEWGNDVSTYGFVGAIRKTLNPPEYNGPCNTCSMVPYVEGAGESIVFCKNCNLPMKKRILYQCIKS